MSKRIEMSLNVIELMYQDFLQLEDGENADLWSSRAFKAALKETAKKFDANENVVKSKVTTQLNLDTNKFMSLVKRTFVNKEGTKLRETLERYVSKKKDYDLDMKIIKEFFSKFSA